MISSPRGGSRTIVRDPLRVHKWLAAQDGAVPEQKEETQEVTEEEEKKEKKEKDEKEEGVIPPIKDLVKVRNV
jgi:hypothetical protein